MTKKMWEKVEDFFTVTCQGFMMFQAAKPAAFVDAGEEWR